MLLDAGQARGVADALALAEVDKVEAMEELVATLLELGIDELLVETELADPDDVENVLVLKAIAEEDEELDVEAAADEEDDDATSLAPQTTELGTLAPRTLFW